MYPMTLTAIGAERIRDWHEKAARDRLVTQARRARRAAAAEARLRRRGSVTQGVAADATPDLWASGLSAAGAAERTGADDRQPVGGRAS